jgi:hypothetical protein
MRRSRELKSRLLDFIEGSSIRTKRMEVGNLSGSTGSIMWEIGKTAIATEKEFGPIDEETATTDSGSRAEEKATASISQREGSIMEISWISKRTAGGERSCLTETIIKEASKMVKWYSLLRLVPSWLQKRKRRPQYPRRLHLQWGVHR